MNYRIVHSNILLLETFLSSCERNKLDYNEYKFLEDDQLKKYFRNKSLKTLTKEDSIGLIAISKNLPVALLNIRRDEFDSEIFEFDCYKISDLIVLSNEHIEIEDIISDLFSYLQNILLRKSKKFHISIGLNNNVGNSNTVFNILIKNGFYYIHTLLTFSSTGSSNQLIYKSGNKDLHIREVEIKDVNHVSSLAQKSFKYSRFHLDPYLDNDKASKLLKISSENSILQHFVDIMYVAEYKNKIIGYYSGKKREISEFNKTFGEATISAVDENYRGLGIFSQLNYNLLQWFSNNTDIAEMGTYLINYPVHKTWINCKLRLIRGVHHFSILFK